MSRFDAVVDNSRLGLAYDPTPRNADYTFDEWLDEWLGLCALRGLRSTTIAGYRRILRFYIPLALGELKLKDLRPQHFNALYLHLLTNGRYKRPAGGLSPRTVRYVHSAIRKALNDAVRLEVLEKNPVLAADPPSRGASRAPVFPTWTPSELRRFLLAASDDPWYPAFHLAAFTGLRRCEVLGLRWTDIDFDGAQLQVVQTVVVVGWYPTLSEPKTEKSRRAVALDKNTVEVLRAHRRRAQGTADDRSLVFPGLGGGPTNPAHLSYRFQRALRGCDVPRIRFHDLRHTHATLALRAGIHPKIVSERLGHATIGLTLDIYSHALPSMQREAAEAVASLVDQIESDGEEK